MVPSSLEGDGPWSCRPIFMAEADSRGYVIPVSVYISRSEGYSVLE